MYMLSLLATGLALSRPPQLTRRSALCGGAAALLPALQPRRASAAAAARIAAYPPLEYLEPIYELKLSLDALQAVVPEPDRWPALKKRLQRFCGGPLSEQYYYAGLAAQYTSKVEYSDLDAFVTADKNERKAAIDQVIDSMRALKAGLEAPAPDASALQGSVRAASQGMARWLSLVPPEDVRRVEELLGAVRRADTNRDGRVGADELGALTDEQQAVWKARVALVGD